jgi:hypothetical protein
LHRHRPTSPIRRLVSCCGCSQVVQTPRKLLSVRRLRSSAGACRPPTRAAVQPSVARLSGTFKTAGKPDSRRIGFYCFGSKATRCSEAGLKAKSTASPDWLRLNASAKFSDHAKPLRKFRHPRYLLISDFIPRDLP